MLHYIKRAISNINEGIVGIAEGIVSFKNSEGYGNKEEDSESSEQASTDKEPTEENMNAQSNESLSSMDENVPDVPDAQQSLNCERLTSQLL